MSICFLFLYSYPIITNTIFCFTIKLRTLATGDLPNLSYVNRKPEPLGSEFKNIVNGISNKMLWIELHEGKYKMTTKEH